jgi:hypothetical protein
MPTIGNNFVKKTIMKKRIALICYHLGIWGIAGFFITLLFGFLSCCANLSKNVFYASLIIFAAMAIVMTSICVIRGCKKIE